MACLMRDFREKIFLLKGSPLGPCKNQVGPTVSIPIGGLWDPVFISLPSPNVTSSMKPFWITWGGESWTKSSVECVR